LLPERFRSSRLYKLANSLGETRNCLPAPLEPGISFVIATIRGILEAPPEGFPTPYPYFFPVLGF
jgi:hypothetical protein